MLVEDPDPIQHLTGVDLAGTEAVHHGRAVLGGLVYLAREVSFVIELDLVLGTANKVDHFAGTEAIIETHPTLVVRILAPGQDVLVAHKVGPLVYHPSSALHTDGIALVQVGVEVGTVAVAFVPTTLEVFVLVKNDPAHSAEVRLVMCLWRG